MTNILIDIFLSIFDFILLSDTKFLSILFLLMILLPILISFIYLNKIKSEKYNELIEVNLNYIKDPGYFGKNFLKIINCTFLDYFKKYDSKIFDKIENLIIEAKLCKQNKKEIIFITNNFYNINKIKSKVNKFKNNECNIIIINKNPIVMDNEMNFEKEYVNYGDLKILKKVNFYSLIVKGNLIIDSEVEINKYLHVEGNIYFNKPSKIGLNIYSSNNIYINSLVSFKRMFANEIKTEIGSNFVFIDQINQEDIDKNKISIIGNLRVEGKIELTPQNKYIIIDGNLVSDSDIKLNGQIWVKGNIFSQKNISISNGVVIGEKGKIKSIIAKKTLTIGPNIKIYGYIHSELISNTYLQTTL